MNIRFADSEWANSELPEESTTAAVQQPIQKKEAQYVCTRANFSGSSFDLQQGCSAEELDTVPADLIDLFMSNKK